MGSLSSPGFAAIPTAEIHEHSANRVAHANLTCAHFHLHGLDTHSPSRSAETSRSPSDARKRARLSSPRRVAEELTLSLHCRPRRQQTTKLPQASRWNSRSAPPLLQRGTSRASDSLSQGPLIPTHSAHQYPLGQNHPRDPPRIRVPCDLNQTRLR